MSLLSEIEAKLRAMPEDRLSQVVAMTARHPLSKQVWIPNPGAQTMAFNSPADLLYFGGAAGSGKTQVLLGLSLTQHRVSRIFRRQYKDIAGEGGLAPALSTILKTWKGYNSQSHVWHVEGTDKSIEFGAFESDKDAESFQGRAADFMGFDEAVHFPHHQIKFLSAWNRTAVAGQRCRIVYASNPPVSATGLWVFDVFGPWLDPAHPNPAKAGELRYYASIGGKETEVDADYVGVVVDSGGTEIEVKPKSRTFIPGSLSENPDLVESGYAAQLMSLPKHLQDALLGGKFTAELEDQDRQVIPVEWVLKAQQRWALRRVELERLPMTSVGADIADGGQDRMVVVALHGTTFSEPKIKPGRDVKATEQKASMILEVAKDDPQIVVDCGGGYGGGLCDMLESNHFRVVRFKGAESAPGKDRDGVREFANARVASIWRFREALDPERGDNIALPPSRELMMELTSFREAPHQEQRKIIKIEDNSDIKKRLGRSPDLAWGYFLAWANPDPVEKSKRASYLAKRTGARANHGAMRNRGKVIGRN
jgi:hypothetical protein